MKAVKDKLALLEKLKGAKDKFEMAVAYIEARAASGKAHSTDGCFQVWSPNGSAQVRLNATSVFDDAELAEILQKRILECEVEIKKIEPVLAMAERVFIAEENAA